MSGIPSDDPWVQFMWDYPGPIPTSAQSRFDAAVAAGVTPKSLVDQARAYRRLCDHQDTLAAPADVWLDAITQTFNDADEEGPSGAEAFSAGVRALRAVKGLSRDDMAARAGVGAATLAQIENDPEAHTPRRPTQLAIADALGWTVDQLVELGAWVLAR